MALDGKAEVDGRHRPSFTTIDRTQRSQLVREQLEAAIVAGDLAPGERLPPERELTETFGVSRVSVREALRALEALGYITISPGVGCFVAPDHSGNHLLGAFTQTLAKRRHDLSEMFDVRAALDALAAERAAHVATREGVKRIRQAQRDFDEVVRGKGVQPLDRLVELDARFHETIAEVGGNTLLAELVRDLNEHFVEARRLTLAPEGRPRQSSDEHRAIAEAIGAHDAEQARLAMGRHVTEVRMALDEFAGRAAEVREG